jgi:hypothetical protein
MIKYAKRQFLNVPEKCTTAHINLRIDETGFMAIKISDCERTIELHSSLKNIESARNAKFKLNTLIEVLQAAISHIEENTQYDTVLTPTFKTLDDARKYISDQWLQNTEYEVEINKTKTIYKNKTLNRQMRIKTETVKAKSEKVKKYRVAISLPFSQI